MRAYRDGLELLSAEWRFRPEWAKVTDLDADLRVYEAIWGAFAKTGIVDGTPSVAYAQEQFGDLSSEQRGAARRLVGAADLRHSLSLETAQRLTSLGIEPNPTNMALATRLVLDARAQAARDLRLGIESATGVLTPPPVPEARVAAPVAPPAAAPPSVSAAAIDGNAIPEKWRTATPLEAAEILIAANPAMLEHRKTGKRAASQVGEQTLRQIRWAAALCRSR